MAEALSISCQQPWNLIYFPINYTGAQWAILEDNVLDSLKKTLVAAKAAADKKAHRIIILDMSSVSAFTNYFVICHGGSSSQIQAITNNIEKTLRNIKVRADHIEGDVSAAAWILMDYGDFIVHIFNEASREYYGLEKLWLDAPQIDFEEDTPDMGR